MSRPHHISIHESRRLLAQALRSFEQMAPALHSKLAKALGSNAFVEYEFLEPVLVEELQKGSNDRVRCAIMSLLQRIGVPETAETLSVLVQAANDPNDDVNSFALACLATCRLEGLPAAVPILVERLNDVRAPVRSYAIQAIKGLGLDLASEAVPAVTAALDDADITVRHHALTVLTWLAPEARDTILPVIVNMALNGQPTAFCESVVQSLIAIDPQHDELDSLLAPVEDANVRDQFLRSLRAAGSRARALRRRVEGLWSADSSASNPGAAPSIGTIAVPSSEQKSATAAKGSKHPDGPEEPNKFWWNGKCGELNCAKLGARLAACGDLYRRPAYAGGLLLAGNQSNIDPVVIDKGRRLAAIINDRVRVRVVRPGNKPGNHVPAAYLHTMLASEGFLQQFRPVDAVVRRAHYLPGFELLRPGYNDGGPGLRFLLVGQEARVERNHEAVKRFLDVMAFATDADRTNAVGAALAVLLRHMWPGAKPLIAVTSTKSHGGKDTVIDFACGFTPKVSISHETSDWAVEKVFVQTVKHRPDVGVVCLKNVRVNGHQGIIGSAFVERLLTDPRPQLHAVGTGDPITIDNHLVVAASANLGRLSEDLMNRALPIHPAPVGNVADRDTPIGNGGNA